MLSTRAESNSSLELTDFHAQPRRLLDKVAVKSLLPPVHVEGAHLYIPHKLPKETKNHALNVAMAHMCN